MLRKGRSMRLLALAIAFICLAGCTQREAERDARRTLRRETIERRQEILPDGKIVQLTTRTVTVENEATGERLSETVAVEAPQVLGDLATLGRGLVTAGATAVAGPAGGAAADMLWQTLAGIGGAGAAAATGKAAIDGRKRRKLEDELEEITDRADTCERQRNELIDGVESAKEHMDKATWEKVSKTLYDNQSDDTIKVVQERTGI